MVENLLKVIHVLEPAISRTPDNVEHVWASINKDPWLALQELEVDLGIPKITVSEILTQDLGRKCIVAKFVPLHLLPEQKEHCAVANDLMQTTQRSRFPQEGHNRRWIVGLWLWSRNKGPVVSMEVTWFSTSKEDVAKVTARSRPF